MVTLSEEQQLKILNDFKSRLNHIGIKFKSKKYYDEQASFIAGVYSSLQTLGIQTPPIWQISVMTNREIIQEL